MQVFVDVLLCLVLIYVEEKCRACVQSVHRILTRSAPLARALRRGGSQQEIDALYLPLRPLHVRIRRWFAEGRSRKMAERVIKGPIVVGVGGIVVLSVNAVDKSAGWLLLAVGIATAVCAVLHVLLAVCESLAFGRETRRLLHVHMPTDGRLGVPEDWSVSKDENNLLIYFLGLLGMVILGFAALNASIHTVYPSAFFTSGSTGDIAWIYSSIATAATIGDGDLSPRSPSTQLAAIVQIAMGPLLLSWLLVIFTGPDLVDRWTPAEGGWRRPSRRRGGSRRFGTRTESAPAREDD